MFTSIRHHAMWCLALTLLAALASHPANAQQAITIGNHHGANAAPLGVDANATLSDYAAGGEYQEIYSSSNFQGVSSGPIIINSIAFASSSFFPDSSTATFDLTLSLSTTNSTVNSPNPNFAANKGADFTQVFGGNLTTKLYANDTFDLVFPTVPFRFDPSQGNLLLDVVIINPSSGPNDVIFDTTDLGQTARVYQSFGSSQSRYTDGPGLWTQFNASPAPVPEVSTTGSLGLLLVLGTGGVMIARKKMRRAERPAKAEQLII